MRGTAVGNEDHVGWEGQGLWSVWLGVQGPKGWEKLGSVSGGAAVSREMVSIHKKAVVLFHSSDIDNDFLFKNRNHKP